MRFQLRSMTACCAILALFAGTSLAAKKPNAGGGGAGMKAVDAMSRALATVVLDETQAASTKQLLADAEGRVQALQDTIKSAADKKAARAAARPELAKILRETRDAIDGVLASDQKKTFHAALKDARKAAKAERDAKTSTKDAKSGKRDSSTKPA